MQKIAILAAIVVAMLAGCEEAPMPEVNEANCQIDRIRQIKDESTRREFASLCAHRPIGPSSLPSNPKRW